MKKYIILLFLSLFTCGKWFAQGNLQFNRVVNYNLTGTTSTTSIQTIQTISIIVPVGKVWKIESASSRIQGSSGLSNGSGSAVASILIDNNFISVAPVASASYLPLWLYEGTHSLQLVVDNIGGSSCTGCVAYGMVTGIEFNVVP